MTDWAVRRGPWLVAIVFGMLIVVLAGELHRHMGAKPVALPLLLFELLEVVLLVGCAAGCALLILRVRVRAAAATTAAMVAALLAGELLLAIEPVTLRTLLVELLEVALLVGATIACALLVRESWSRAGDEVSGTRT